MLTDAMCGLTALLSAQFCDEDYSATDTFRSVSEYSYATDDGMQNSISDLFRIRFPIDWSNEDRYDFDWSELKDMDDPFDEFDYSAIA